MTTGNEKWQGKPEEGAYNAGREGNDFRSSYGRERNFDRPRRNFREGGERSYGERRSYNGGERSFNSDRNFGERRSFNNDRPRRSFNNEGGERNFNGERRSYNGG
ncbi:MAG: pseudouridine synthase, partial [Bacteroidales bacterium]|nr:pseudouridine synthase [Bacteroidales bacterium]